MDVNCFMTFSVTKVFHKERLNGHYEVISFVMGHTLSSTPFLLVIAIISSSISYFMVGLHPGFVHFLYFMLSLFLSLSVVEGLMMAIASVVPNFLMGIIIGAGIQVFAFVNNIFYKLLVQDFCLINYLLVLGDVHVSCWIFSIAK